MNAGQESKTLASFLFCGGIAAAIELGSRWLVNLWLSYSMAIIIARLTGMLVAFLLFKFLVFKTAGSGRTQQEGGWFVLVNLLAMLQVWVVSVGLAHSIFPWAGVDFHYALPGSTRELAPEDIAHFIGVSTTALSSFLGHKFFTFKKEAQ